MVGPGLLLISKANLFFVLLAIMSNLLLLIVVNSMLIKTDEGEDKFLLLVHGWTKTSDVRVSWSVMNYTCTSNRVGR